MKLFFNSKAKTAPSVVETGDIINVDELRGDEKKYTC